MLWEALSFGRRLSFASLHHIRLNTTAVAHLYLSSPSNGAARGDMSDTKQLVKPELYTLTIEQLQALPAVLQPAVSLNMSALRTNGDGSCAMHALLGRPELSPMGYFEFWTADARAVAISHCGPSLEVLQQRVSIPEALRSIQTCLWKQFVEGLHPPKVLLPRPLEKQTTNEAAH